MHFPLTMSVAATVRVTTAAAPLSSAPLSPSPPPSPLAATDISPVFSSNRKKETNSLDLTGAPSEPTAYTGSTSEKTCAGGKENKKMF